MWSESKSKLLLLKCLPPNASFQQFYKSYLNFMKCVYGSLMIPEVLIFCSLSVHLEVVKYAFKVFVKRILQLFYFIWIYFIFGIDFKNGDEFIFNRSRHFLVMSTIYVSKIYVTSLIPLYLVPFKIYKMLGFIQEFVSKTNFINDFFSIMSFFTG